MLYTPQIRVRVATHGTGKPRNSETLDISDDLVQGSLTIRTNGIHTFSFQLQNALRKYDGVLQPMDRIVVEMKRITWVRVFSGYLNNGPVFSVWPRVLTLTASCTLKRLQFWYWDSTTQASVDLMYQTMKSKPAETDQTTPTSPSNTGQTSTTATPKTPAGIVGSDEAARNTAVRVLEEVVGWKQDKIHIAEVPAEWYKMAEELFQMVIKNVKVPDELIGDFSSGGTVGGTAVGAGGAAGGLMGNGTLSAGNYGGTAYSAEQAANAATIYNVAAGRGLPGQAAVIGIATAWAESSMRNLNTGDRDSRGLFQQRPSQGWGTVAQVTQPVYAAGKFYDALVKVPGWQSMSVAAAAQAVQRSAFPGAYTKWEATARAVVAAISGGKAGAAGKPGAVAGGVAGAKAGAVAGAAMSTGGAKVGSGRNVALVAHNVIASKPPGSIRYSLGGDDAYSVADPKVLDCSSFVDWVYYHAVGRPWISPRSNAAGEQSASKSIDVATAKATKGALLFVGSPAHHVEVSLGNGMTAAAHTDGIPLANQVTISAAGGNFTGAGLMPGVDYSDAATNQAAAAALSKVLGIPTSVSDPNESGTGTAAGGADGAAGAAAGPDGNAAFNAFVNVYVWGLQPTFSGNLFSGARAMMNDEPILPWISNLMTSIMRSWCSAPNGDFMAWFPDYFGLWDSAGKMNVKSIELLDFTVDWYDQEIVTHQYVVGSPVGSFDTRTATVQAKPGSGSALNSQLRSDGIATMEFPEIFKAIFGLKASDQFVKDYLDRFGGRPNVINVPQLITATGAEFFFALYLFMQRWANQFRANIPMTFMPELWPGMLIVLPEYQFQAYILEVNHVFQFGPGGGFQTKVKICAPARTTQKTDIFGLLPLAGSARPPAAPTGTNALKNTAKAKNAK